MAVRIPVAIVICPSLSVPGPPPSLGQRVFTHSSRQLLLLLLLLVVLRLRSNGDRSCAMIYRVSRTPVNAKQSRRPTGAPTFAPFLNITFPVVCHPHPD